MAITPGPNNVMMTTSGANFGFRRTVPHMLGVTCGFAAMTFMVCVGLGAIFSRVPQLQVWLAWVGAAYLVYLAWKLVGAGATGESSSARPLTFIQAVLFQPANPKGWLTTITTAALFLPKTGNRYLALGVMLIVIFIVMIPSNVIWTAFGSTLRRFLDDSLSRRIFNIIMALLLLGTAAFLLFE